ncbi:MAG: tRNA (adenosine(37)-N6)-threonylcarbamoyltransferase complex ATPase subunit type 1 TsaE [Anaerolineae bacterium]|nr:tRNA (adenosine(37)-N6)-threonylcarbamoyltransferase complex ATPase subunit type 1 TsaE [Anaerolineae bacterium]
MSPVLEPNTLDFISHSESQTHRLGARLAEYLGPGDVVALEGDLGSGKTRWVQGVCRGLGVSGPVVSPTFTLVNEYHDGRLPIYHIDLYRLDSVAEIETFGLDDYLYGDGVTLIEWADRISGQLPPAHLTIQLHHMEMTKRRVVIRPYGRRFTTLLADYKKAVFAQPYT